MKNFIIGLMVGMWCGPVLKDVALGLAKRYPLERPGPFPHSAD